MNSNQIVSRFLEHKDEFDCVSLTRRQVDWLVDTLRKEDNFPNQLDTHHNITVQDADGAYHLLAIYPNGAGFIRPVPQTQETQMSDELSQKYLEIAAQLRADGHGLAADELEKAVKNSSNNGQNLHGTQE